MALPRSSWLSSTKVGTLEVQQVLPKRSRGPREALVWGWPTAVRMDVRTELPPEPGEPVYGPAAREWARRVMREAKREKINFGWATKKSLCKVAKGERPLGYALWKQSSDYLARKRREREVAQRPLKLLLSPRGLRVQWRRPSPP